MAKEITINELAVMVQKGFEKTASGERIDDLEKWTNGKFEKVEARLYKIEKLFTAEDRKRIDKLEMRVDYLENILALSDKK